MSRTLVQNDFFWGDFVKILVCFFGWLKGTFFWFWKVGSPPPHAGKNSQIIPNIFLECLLREGINKKNGYLTVSLTARRGGEGPTPPLAWPQAFVKISILFLLRIWFFDSQNTFYLMVKGLFPSTFRHHCVPLPQLNITCDHPYPKLWNLSKHFE